MFTYVALPSSAPTDLFGATGTLLTDLWPLLALCIGVPLAFWIIEIIINLIAGRRETARFAAETSEAAIGLSHEEAVAIAMHEQFEELMEEDEDISIYTE